MMELKLSKIIHGAETDYTSNRTILELKHIQQSGAFLVYLASNRTLLELKQNIKCISDLFSGLSIESSWI